MSTDYFLPKFLQKQKKPYYDANGNLVYLCIHKSPTAPLTNTKWLIWRHYYDANDNWLGQKGPLEGSATGRASLEWGSDLM